MSGEQELTYALDFAVRCRRRPKSQAARDPGRPAQPPIPRIARLLALAIRIEARIREHALPDYAEVARRGKVTRARLTQIMKLLDLAPDIQEQILFLPPLSRLNERNLRPVLQRIDWDEQRRMFHQVISHTSRGIRQGSEL